MTCVPTLAAFLLALGASTGAPRAAEEGLLVTIYNQDFALVKETLTLTLKQGTGKARVTDVTSLLEPDSVILGDPKDPNGLRVLEQNYEGDPLSEGFLLRQHEGRMVVFQRINPATGAVETLSGRVVRSGYAPQQPGWQISGYEGSRSSLAAGAPPASPIVEVDGKIQFSLPGQPLFDLPGPDAILKPTLLWTLWSGRAGPREVVLSYLTGGLRWEATYNLVAPETGDLFDMVGWITLENQSGAEFQDARVKLMAGEVSKIQPPTPQAFQRGMMVAMEAAPGPQVTEKAFDEYHLYTLQQPTTLRNREIKQVEFCRAEAVPAARLYVYDGAQSGTKVATMLEFKNDKSSGLGIALPKGTMKIYRNDSDGRREFIGENPIDHTPADEKVRIHLGNAFDVVGERRQTSYRSDDSRREASEAFEIKLRNHKKKEVEVRVVEHLYRWATWSIAEPSDPFTKTDSRTAEFRVKVAPDQEKVITYRVRYTW
jgi:hypothetical protein